MIPTPRLALLLALAVPMLLLGVIDRAGLVLAILFDVGLIGAVVLDRLRAPDPATLGVARTIPDRWVQGRGDRIRLTVRNRTSRSADVTIRDLRPTTFAVRRDTVRMIAAPRDVVTAAYGVVPTERGRHRFDGFAVRTRGPLQLVERQAVIAAPADCRVYPDLVTLSTREAVLVSPSTWMLGVRRGRYQGEGREFHQLRQYVPGDDIRHLDWKAFAHRGRPTVREFQLERNQRVLLLIDGGRMMTTRVADRSRFDWAVQAAGRLARAVLALDDGVGVTVYARDVRATVPPARGAAQLGAISDMLSDARPELDEPDLGTALHHVLRKNPRRSLVVVFTELSDPRAAREAVRHIGALGTRHLGLVVTLADADLERERHVEVRDPVSAYRRVAADELSQDAMRTERALQARGAMVVRARADALAAETVERYVEIKRRGRL